MRSLQEEAWGPVGDIDLVLWGVEVEDTYLRVLRSKSIRYGTKVLRIETMKSMKVVSYPCNVI